MGNTIYLNCAINYENTFSKKKKFLFSFFFTYLEQKLQKLQEKQQN